MLFLDSHMENWSNFLIWGSAKVAFGDTCTANNFLILFLTSFSLAEMPIKRQLPLLSGVVTGGRLLLMSKDIPLLIFTTMLYSKVPLKKSCSGLFIKHNLSLGLGLVGAGWVV